MPFIQQEEPQQQNPYLSPMVVPPMPDNPNQDFFRYRIDNTDILDELQHQLKGEIYANGVYTRKFKPQANDEGISVILNVVYSCGINKNILLGYLTHEEIYTRCRLMWKRLAKLFAFGYNRFGVRQDMRDQLIVSIVSQIHSGLSRSEGGKEAEQLSTATQKVEHRITEESNKGGGFSLNPMNVFRRK